MLCHGHGAFFERIKKKKEIVDTQMGTKEACRVVKVEVLLEPRAKA